MMGSTVARTRPGPADLPAKKVPDMQSLKGEQAADRGQLVGKAALIASVGDSRGYADWTNPDHRLRRLLAEFLGMAGLTFVLSGGAAILARYGGHGLQPWQTVLVLSAVSALWLVVAVFFLGDISAHFNPVGLDYRIGPGRAGRLGSSLSDHFGRLRARTLPAGLPDGAGPGPGVQGRRALGAPPPERGPSPPDRPGPIRAGRPAVARGAIATGSPPAVG
jgi:hypothetical protein